MVKRTNVKRKQLPNGSSDAYVSVLFWQATLHVVRLKRAKRSLTTFCSLNMLLLLVPPLVFSLNEVI